MTMSGEEYREAIDQLGFKSYTAFAQMLKVTPRTEWNWWNQKPPQKIEILLRLLLFIQSQGVPNIPRFVDGLLNKKPTRETNKSRK